MKYMSASLQYSDYSGVEDFVIPYDLIGTGQEEGYLRQCSMTMKNYQEIIRSGVDNDSAGYCAPQMLPTDIIRVDFPKLCEASVLEEGVLDEDTAD